MGLVISVKYAFEVSSTIDFLVYGTVLFFQPPILARIPARMSVDESKSTMTFSIEINGHKNVNAQPTVL
jgi:hypothetical protein